MLKDDKIDEVVKSSNLDKSIELYLTQLNHN